MTRARDPAPDLVELMVTRLPAVLVWLGAEAATDSVAPRAGAYQRITATLIVAHVIAAPNSARGTGARDPMARLVDETRAALNGWRPADSPGQPDTLALRRERRGARGRAGGGVRHATPAGPGLRGGGTLTDTGRLRGSISRSVSGPEVAVGTNLVYAAIHHFGGTIVPKEAGGVLAFTGADGESAAVKSVTLPARPWLEIDAVAEADIADVVAEYLRKALAA